MNHFKQLLLAASMLVALGSMSQVTYQNFYGDSEYKVFADLTASSNDHIVGAGFWTPSTMMMPYQPLVTKVNVAGTVMWAKEYTSTGVGKAESVASTADGGFLIAGQVDTILGTGGSQNGYVIKTDANGDLEWMSIIGDTEDEEFTRVYEAPNGEVIAIGTYRIAMSSDEYFWFVKMSATGTVIQSFVYFPSANAEARALAFHPDGGYVIGGVGRHNFIDEAFLFKISDVGVLEWYKTYGTFSGTDVIHDLIIEEDKSVVFAGTRYQSSYDVFIGKSDSLGNLEWMKNYGGAEHDQAYRLLDHSDGGYLIGGGTEGLDGFMGPLLWKTNTDGDVQWAHVYGDTMHSGAVGLVHLTSDMYAIGGTILPNQGTAAGFIHQVDTDGNGCNFTTVAFPSVTETITEDTPTPYATLGPSGTVFYNPVVSDVTMITNTDCSNLSVSEKTLEKQVKVFPNPVDNGNELRISFEEILNATINVDVYDCSGRVVFSESSAQQKMSISTEGWSPGVYLLNIHSSEQTLVRKVIVR